MRRNLAAPILGTMSQTADSALEPIGAVQRTQVGREATEPMREDIRLLGAILGDTVREQNGDATFDLVERARVESFRVRRSEIDRTELARLFDGVDVHQAIPVIRAFTHFALLANVAEDIHRERRRAVHEAAGEPPQNSSLAATYLKLEDADLDADRVADALVGALVAPVITAHPTETRRRTVFDTQHRITELMRLRLLGHHRTEDGRDIERELRRHILTLWQTALIRLSRLKIQDEIETGLRYYPAAFLDVIPRVNAEVRAALQARWPGTRPAERTDPAAGIVDRRRPRRQPERHRARWCGWRPAAPPTPRSRTTSPSSPRWRRSCRCRCGWCTSATSWPHWPTPATNRPAPTNRTAGHCAVVHARLTATARQILDRQPEHELDLGMPPYAGPAELLGRPRRRRRVAARARQRGARRRPAGSATGSGAGLRISPVRSGHAAELRRARGGGRRAAGMGRGAPRLRVAGRAGAGGAAGRRAGHPPAADRAGRRAVGVGAQGTRHRRRRGARGARVRAAGGAELHHLDVPVGLATCSRPPSCSRRPACSTPRVEHPYAPGRHRPAVRDHRRPAARLVDSRSGARPSALPRAGGRARATARR